MDSTALRLAYEKFLAGARPTLDNRISLGGCNLDRIIIEHAGRAENHVPRHTDQLLALRSAVAA